jgi:hypothetical protein
MKHVQGMISIHTLFSCRCKNYLEMPDKTPVQPDNTTPHPAGRYDQNITITIPCYHAILEEIMAFVESFEEKPASWLDTGCGI